MDMGLVEENLINIEDIRVDDGFSLAYHTLSSIPTAVATSIYSSEIKKFDLTETFISLVVATSQFSLQI